MAYQVRFRIRHLLGLILLASIGLWLSTQAGMKTAEIEVLEASGLSSLGPDGSHDHWGPNLATLCVRFNQPDDGLKQMRLFLNTTRPLQAEELLDRRIFYRYRVRPILWLKPDNYIDRAIDKLGLREEDIEEMIIETIASDGVGQRRDLVSVQSGQRLFLGRLQRRQTHATTGANVDLIRLTFLRLQITCLTLAGPNPQFLLEAAIVADFPEIVPDLLLEGALRFTFVNPGRSIINCLRIEVAFRLGDVPHRRKCS